MQVSPTTNPSQSATEALFAVKNVGELMCVLLAKVSNTSGDSQHCLSTGPGSGGRTGRPKLSSGVDDTSPLRTGGPRASHLLRTKEETLLVSLHTRVHRHSYNVRDITRCDWHN